MYLENISKKIIILIIRIKGSITDKINNFELF